MSIRALQLPKHLYLLSATEWQCKSWLHTWGCKLIRLGWISHCWLSKDTNLVWIEQLTNLVNNTIIIF